MSYRKERKALKRRKVAEYSYRDHLLDLFFVQNVDGNDLPGRQTAELRRTIKRQTKVRG